MVINDTLIILAKPQTNECFYFIYKYQSYFCLIVTIFISSQLDSWEFVYPNL